MKARICQLSNKYVFCPSCTVSVVLAFKQYSGFTTCTDTSLHLLLLKGSILPTNLAWHDRRLLEKGFLFPSKMHVYSFFFLTAAASNKNFWHSLQDSH